MSSSASAEPASTEPDRPRRDHHLLVLGLAALLAALLIVVGVLALLGQGSASSPPKNALDGLVLTPFPAPLPELNGRASTVAPWRANHLTALVFFADWCAICHQELPALARALGHGRLGVAQVVGVDGDLSAATARAFVRSNHVRFPSFQDVGDDVSTVLAPTYPTTVVVDHAGRVVGVRLGVVTGPQLRAMLARLER
jgi:hypothetical protein